MPRDVEMTVEFCCPQCGGDHFSSDVRAGTYYCKGIRGRRCGFAFPFADMWKHSAQVTRVRFETPAEYEQASRGKSVC